MSLKDIGPLPVLSDEYKQPYPILFYAKHTKASIAVEGDVQEAMDKVIGRNVYRIRGAISAKNHVTWQDMDIAGPTLFLQAFLPEPYISTMHFEVCTKNNQSLRISISTLYNGDEPKFLGRSLRLPFPIHPGWFIMAINFDSIIRSYCTPAASNDGYTLKSIKKIQACSNIILREVVSAPLSYFDGGKMLPKELNVKPQSKPFDFFVLDGNYSWKTILAASATVFAPTPTSKFKPEMFSPVRKVASHSPVPPPIVVETPNVKEVPTVDITPIKGVVQSIDNNTAEKLASQDEPSQETKTHKNVFEEENVVEAISMSSKAADQEKSTTVSKEINTFDTPVVKRIDHASTADHVPTSSPARCDLSLKRVIGYGCGPAVLLYGSNLLLCGVGTTLVMVDLTSGANNGNYPQQTGLWRAFPDRQPGEAKYAQSFLRGHRNKIGLIEVSVNEKYMITAETEVRNGQIYLWNLLNGSRVATMCPFDGYVVSVGFSPSESQIVTVGTDSKGRHKIIIWQIATLLQAHVTLSGSIDHPSIVARQLSDFSISKVIFDPISETALVTCGRENIRLWRTKKQHLSGRPILLNEYCRGFIYHDLALVRDATNGSFLFAASNKGMVLKICYQTEQVLSAFQLHSESVNTFQVFSGYAVTGGDDCRLRIWPMDFGDFLLEARHEGGVKVVNGGRQGRKLVIGTKAGTLGLLDVTQHSYETILRSHVGPMVEIATRSGWNEIATISTDRTTRVWNVDTGVQTVEFASDFDTPTAITYHHTHHALFCGYQSGVIRMFDVIRAATIAEIDVHQGHSVCVVKSFMLDGVDVLMSMDTNGEVFLINCETKVSIASFSTKIITGIPGTSAAKNKFLCVELFGDNKFVSICSGGCATLGNNALNNPEKASPNGKDTAINSTTCGDDLVIIYLPSMTIAYSEKTSTMKKHSSSLFNNDEFIHAMGYVTVPASLTSMNFLTFVTSRRILAVPLEITDYPQCLLDRSAVVVKKHDCKSLRDAYFSASCTTIALISATSASAVNSSASLLSTPSSTGGGSLLSTPDEERVFSIIQLRLEQTQTKERMVISNPIRQRLAAGDISYFSFLKEELAATSDRYGCLTIWKVSSNNPSFIDTNKDERTVSTPSVPSCLIDHSLTKECDATPLLVNKGKDNNMNDDPSIEILNSPMRSLYLNSSQLPMGDNTEMMGTDHAASSLKDDPSDRQEEEHALSLASDEDNLASGVGKSQGNIDLDHSFTESMEHAEDCSEEQMSQSLDGEQNQEKHQEAVDEIHRQELKADLTHSVVGGTENPRTATMILASQYKGFLKCLNPPNSLSKYIARSDSNCVCLIDCHNSHEDEYLELSCCPEAKILGVQLFNNDSMVVAIFSTPQSSHHLAIWCKQSLSNDVNDFKFNLVTITDSFFTGKIPSTGPILLYSVGPNSFLVAYVVLGQDCFLRYYIVSQTSSPGIVGSITLPPIADYKAMDLRVVNPFGGTLLLSTQTFVCLLSLGFGYRRDQILWIDEVKPADLILASYGCFLPINSDGKNEYLHINLCKSAKLRVHVIEQILSNDFRVESSRPTIRAALAPLPTLESFGTSNPKGFELLFAAGNDKTTKVQNVTHSKGNSIKGHVYLRMGANLRIFQLSYTTLSQIALKANMHCLAKKTLKAVPDFMDTISSSKSSGILTLANSSTIWTLDGQIVRQSLVDAPRHNVLICRPNSLLEEQQVKDVRRSVNLMTFGASVSSVFNVASEAKIHEMNFEANATLITYTLSPNSLWLALGFSNDFLELYDTISFKRWYRFSTKTMSSSLPLMKLWFVGQEADTTPGLLMLAFEHQTIIVQFSSINDHVQHRCVSSVTTLKSIQSMTLLPVEETLDETDSDEDDSNYDARPVSTMDTRLTDCLHKFEDFYHCASILAGKEGRYEHWDRIFVYEVKKYKLDVIATDEMPSSSSSAMAGTVPMPSSRQQDQDEEPRVLLLGSILKENDNTTLLYFGVWAHGLQERSVTILIPKDEALCCMRRFGPIVVIVTTSRIVFINQEELLSSVIALTTSASANSLSSCSPLTLQDCCILSLPLQMQFQEIIDVKLKEEWLVWSYVTKSGNIITFTQRLPRKVF